MASLSPNIRAADKVRQYLLGEFGNASTTKRLPTMRQVAAHLGVSLPTVHSVYKALANEGYIQSRAGNGSTFNPRPVVRRRVVRIAINMAPPPGEDLSKYWVGGIYAGIMHAIMAGDANVQLIPIPDGEDGKKLFTQKAHAGECDGLIMLAPETFPAQKDFEKVCAKHQIPIVYLRAPDGDTSANFVEPGFFKAAQLLGQAYVAEGRRQVLMVIMGKLRTQTEGHILAGLSLGLGEFLWKTAELRHLCIESMESIGKVFGDYLERAVAPPDAIFADDTVAVKIFHEANRRGIKIPEQMSIIGSTGMNLSDTECPKLTRVNQPFETIGTMLLQTICRRIEEKGKDVPGIYIPLTFCGGATTTTAENRVLSIAKEK